MDRVSMFRSVTRWDGWQQFDNPRHEANTRDADTYDVREFVSEAEARKQWEEELLSDEAVEAGARAPFDRGGSVTYWPALHDDEKGVCREDTREVLRAALASINQKGGE
jgi:hypothetical protein